MSYELKIDDEENKVLGQGGEGALVGGGGQNALATGGGGVTPSSGQPFTNVGAYLDANKSQAEGLANKVAGNIKTQGEGVRGQITQAGQNFNQAAQDKTVRLDQGLADQAKNDSVGFVKDQNNVQKFAQQRDATYTGPKDLTDYNYAGLQQSAKNAAQKGGLVDTASGREQLVSEVSRRPTAGQNALNGLLLSGQPSAMQILQGAKAGVSDLNSYLDSVNASSIEAGKRAQAETDATRAAIQNQFRGEGGVLPSLYGDINKRVGNLQGEAAGLNQAAGLFSQGKVGDLTDAQLAALGGGREELESFQSNLGRFKELGGDFDVSNYIKSQAPEAQITRENAATREELARLQALESLFGGEAQIGLTPEAGTAKTDLVDFDKEGAYTDLISMLKKAETDRAAQDLGNFYYQNIGQHTGEGHAPARAGRETPALVRNLLAQGRGLNDEELKQYFNNYAAPAPVQGQPSRAGGISRAAMDDYIRQFNEQLNQAQTRLGQARVKQPTANVVLK
jgi:hypothetical protein